MLERSIRLLKSKLEEPNPYSDSEEDEDEDSLTPTEYNRRKMTEMMKIYLNQKLEEIEPISYEDDEELSSARDNFDLADSGQIPDGRTVTGEMLNHREFLNILEWGKGKENQYKAMFKEFVKRTIRERLNDLQININ